MEKVEIYGEVKNWYIYLALRRNCVLKRKTKHNKNKKIKLWMKEEYQGVL